MTFLIPTLIRKMVDKIPIFLVEKKVVEFQTKTPLFLSVFQAYLGQNEAHRRKTNCPEQLTTWANDSHHFWENLFFEQFSHFLSSSIFAKIGQKFKFPGFNANRLEIKLRAQRGMTFLIWTLIRKMIAKIPVCLVEK